MTNIKNADSTRYTQQVNAHFLSQVFGYRGRLPRSRFPVVSDDDVVIYNPCTFSFVTLLHVYETFSIGKAVQHGYRNSIDEELFRRVQSHEFAIMNVDPNIGYSGGYYFCIRKKHDTEERVLFGAQRNPKGLIAQMKEEKNKTITLAEAILFDLFLRWDDQEVWTGIPGVSLLTSTTVCNDVIRDATGGAYRDPVEEDLLDSDEENIVERPILLSFDNDDLSGKCCPLFPTEEMIFKRIKFRTS